MSAHAAYCCVNMCWCCYIWSAETLQEALQLKLTTCARCKHNVLWSLTVTFGPAPFVLAWSAPVFCFWLHASGRWGVDLNWGCGTMSLFSFRVCSSTHHTVASGSTPADWPHAAAEATSPHLTEITPCTIRYTGKGPYSSRWFFWVLECAHAVSERAAVEGNASKSAKVQRRLIPCPSN